MYFSQRSSFHRFPLILPEELFKLEVVSFYDLFKLFQLSLFLCYSHVHLHNLRLLCHQRQLKKRKWQQTAKAAYDWTKKPRLIYWYCYATAGHVCLTNISSSERNVSATSCQYIWSYNTVCVLHVLCQKNKLSSTGQVMDSVDNNTGYQTPNSQKASATPDWDWKKIQIDLSSSWNHLPLTPPSAVPWRLNHVYSLL